MSLSHLEKSFFHRFDFHWAVIKLLKSENSIYLGKLLHLGFYSLILVIFFV